MQKKFWLYFLFNKIRRVSTIYAQGHHYDSEKILHGEESNRM